MRFICHFCGGTLEHKRKNQKFLLLYCLKCNKYFTFFSNEKRWKSGEQKEKVPLNDLLLKDSLVFKKCVPCNLFFQTELNICPKCNGGLEQ